MAEILFLTLENADSCSFYRSAGVLKDLREKTKHNITLVQITQAAMNWSFLTQFDLVMFQRPFNKDHLNICGYLKQCGVKLWLDFDDNLFALNPENPAIDYYDNPETSQCIKMMLGLADVVSVPVEYLRQVYSEFNKNICIIPNAFNDSFFPRPELLPRTNHIVWRGPPAHVFDLYTYLNEINQLTSEFSDWRFTFMGFNPAHSILWWFLSNVSNRENIPSADIAIYMKRLFDLAPSCLHVPLVDNAFNRCKSNISFIEGSYAGAVCVVPAWWNVPGALPYTDGKSYYEAIKAIVTGEVDKVAMNMEAWSYIMDVLPLSKVNVERLQILNSLL